MKQQNWLDINLQQVSISHDSDISNIGTLCTYNILQEVRNAIKVLARLGSNAVIKNVIQIHKTKGIKSLISYSPWACSVRIKKKI